MIIYKNYFSPKILILKLFLNLKIKKDVVINADVYFIKMEKLSPVFKSIFAVVVTQLHLKLLIL